MTGGDVRDWLKESQLWKKASLIEYLLCSGWAAINSRDFNTFNHLVWEVKKSGGGEIFVSFSCPFMNSAYETGLDVFYLLLNLQGIH